MSHIVIHEDRAGVTQYRQFDDLGSAVHFVEEQRNAGVESVRLFEMNELRLAVKSYYKVEIVGEVAEAPTPAPVEESIPEALIAATPTPTPMPTPAPPAVEPVPAAVTEVMAEPIDDVSYVEAAMASPIEAFASEAPPLSDYVSEPGDSVPSTEGRRGLFGR